MKKIMLLAMVCLAGVCSFGQSFHNGIGVTGFYGKPGGLKGEISAAFTYSPYFCFRERGDMSLSIGMPLSLGIMGVRNLPDYEGDYIARALLNVPLMLNINRGCGASRNKTGFGYFAGVGFAYHFQSNLDEVVIESDKNGTKEPDEYTYGPVVNAGVRFAIGDRNIEVKASYMKGISGSRANVLGLTAIFNFRSAR